MKLLGIGAGRFTQRVLHRLMKENFFNSRGLNLVVYGLFYNSTVHLRSFGLRPHTLGGIRFDVDVAEPLRRRSSV